MAVTGRKPKPEGAAVHRNQPVHEWVDVPNVPYRGKKPTLPKGTPPATRAWWNDVTSLPHCALWSKGDWRFALDTARVHAAFVGGDMARAAELRLRERAMGTTTDALRDLRIRYVDQAGAPEQAVAPSSGVADFEAERRRRLMDAG